MLIGLCLFLMSVLTVFSMVLGSILPASSVGDSIETWAIVNGTRQTLEVSTGGGFFFIDPVLGLIGMLVVIIAIVSLIGLKIFNTGFSDTAVKIITSSILYGGLWSLLSVAAMPLVVSIEYFGSLIYVVLTIAYIFGVIKQMMGGGNTV